MSKAGLPEKLGVLVAHVIEDRAYRALALVHVLGRGLELAPTIDHKMLLRRDDPVLADLQKRGEPVVVLDVNPTAENIARLIYDFATDQGFPVVEVRLWETDTCFASYCPDDRVSEPEA